MSQAAMAASTASSLVIDPPVYVNDGVESLRVGVTLIDVMGMPNL